LIIYYYINSLDEINTLTWPKIEGGHLAKKAEPLSIDHHSTAKIRRKWETNTKAESNKKDD
jgi:hypothetical protein